LFGISKYFVQIQTDNTTDGYIVFGFGGGAQLVHRMVLFMPDARISKAVAANSGWYTFPDFETVYPYGLKKSGLKTGDIKKAFEKELIVMVGSWDRDENKPGLNKTRQAMRQGKHQLERAQNFLKVAEQTSREMNAPLNWRLVVPSATAGGLKKVSSAAWKEIFN